MYTLWSHGQLLGESALDYVRVIPKLRTGDLDVTEKGLVLIERLSQTREDGYRSARRAVEEDAEASFDESERTLFADLAALNDQYEALELELRGPNGTVIPTESIYIADTEYLQRIGMERDEEDEAPAEGSTEVGLDPDILAALEDQLAEFEREHRPWLPEEPDRPPVRFQISVTLTDEWAIP